MAFISKGSLVIDSKFKTSINSPKTVILGYFKIIDSINGLFSQIFSQKTAVFTFLKISSPSKSIKIRLSVQFLVENNTAVNGTFL